MRARPTYGVQRPESRSTRVLAATRGVASVAGVATTLGLVVVLTPKLTPGLVGIAGPLSTDAQTASPTAAADVVETAAPSPVKKAASAKATAKPKTHSRKTAAPVRARATHQPVAARPKATPRPAPRPRATPRPTPRPTPVPTKPSGKP